MVGSLLHRQKLPLAQLKPAQAMDPEIPVRCAANRFRVVRQARYSLNNENCIGLVLFLNGLPVAMQHSSRIKEGNRSQNARVQAVNAVQTTACGQEFKSRRHSIWLRNAEANLLVIEFHQLFFMSASNAKPPFGSRVALKETRGDIRY